MISQSPITKYIMGFVYFGVFAAISIGIVIGFVTISAIVYSFLNINIENMDQIIGKISNIIGLLLLIYSSWLAKESATAFSENNCFFIEAVIVSFKKTVSYLQFLPVFGGFFDKQQKSGDDRNHVKRLENITRFDE